MTEFILPDLGNTPNHEKPAVYIEDALWVFRAYAIGNCHLKLALVSLGKAEEFSVAVRKAFEDGHEYEAIVKDRLRRYGVRITDEQDEMNWPILPGFAILRGHRDGFAPDGFPALPKYGLPNALELPGIVEIKSSNEDGYDDWLIKGLDAYPGYRMQADAYCLEARERTGNPDIGIYFVVICKADVARLNIRWYPGPQTTLADYRAKAVQVVSLHNRLMGGEDLKCQEWEDQVFKCSFEEWHGKPAEKTELVLEDPKILQIARQVKELAPQIEELEAKQKQLKAILQIKQREMCVDRVVLAAPEGEESLVLYRQKSTPSCDRKAMRRDHPELMAQVAAIEEDYKTQGDHLRIGRYSPPKPKTPKAKGKGKNADRDQESIEDLFQRIGPPGAGT